MDILSIPGTKVAAHKFVSQEFENIQNSIEVYLRLAQRSLTKCDCT